VHTCWFVKEGQLNDNSNTKMCRCYYFKSIVELFDTIQVKALYQAKNIHFIVNSIMKHLKIRMGLLLLALWITITPTFAKNNFSKTPIYLNTAYSFEERSADLVSRLTLEEKQSLLGNSMAAIPRLGIKSYNVWSEALHGILSGANTSVGLAAPTSFPNSVALGSAWDPNLMQREAAAIADEARAFNATGTKGLTYWSPVVEPVRDPRWGRTGESFGEDPFLVSQIAGGFVRGMVGNSPTYIKTVPCAKHFFANNSEFDRHVGSSNMDGRDMREFYLSPYKKLIEQDNLPSIMSSYNAVNGVPTSASKLYLDTIVRRLYGMRGYITGDCAAIEDIYTGHYYVKTAAEATAMGLKAGVDSDCGSVYQRSALDALKKGLITMGDIDKALMNTFTIRMRTGEFDPSPQVPYALYQAAVVSSPANKALAYEVATKTPVLLKNNFVGNTGRKALPLDPTSLKRIALVGPQSDEVELGPYSGRPASENMISPLSGIKKYLADKGFATEIVHSSGGSTSSKSNLLYVANFELKKVDGIVTKYDATKYSASSKGITVGSGMGSIEQVRSINDNSWTAYNNVDLTNIDTIGIFVNIPTEGGIIEVRAGSPEGNLLTTLDATVAAGNRSGGVYGGGNLMKVKVNRLGFNGPQTLYFVYKAPENKGINPETIEAAKKADVVVVFVGTDEKTATEEADRLTLLLPGNQVELIKAVAAVNPNTIVVMQTLGCVEVEEFKNMQNIPGIVWVGYNGQAQGDAIAGILFGEVNPGGKLNGTWYKSLNDLPEITDYTLRGENGKNGRTFWYFNKDVSYEFGFGLSYTSFEYSNFRISKNMITPNDKITISVDVKNIGGREGDEVVQIYMKTPESPASLERPIKRLKGFQRVSIPAGQTKTVSIDIDCADLWFWDMKNNKITFDQGRYLFEIGASSKDIKGIVSAIMSGAFKPELKVVVAGSDKVVLENGSSTQTSVTASMTDDSFYDLSKANVTYSSNNASVAVVDAKGLVTAKGTGIATITAYVTVEGKTVSGNYPLKVMPNLKASSITVNQKKITDFSSAKSQYSFVMGSASSKAPVVKGIPVDPNITVETVQAKGVPGTSTVALIDFNTYDKKEYVINFGIKSLSDEFNGVLGKQWRWVRENKENWNLTQKMGSLSITSQKGDLVESSNNAENLLLQSANTDWTIETKLVCSRKPSGMSQNAGILAYQNDDNFVKLFYGASFGRRGFGGPGALTAMPTEQPGAVQLLIEEKGNQKVAATLSMDSIIGADNTLVLRLVKKGSTYTAYCSPDGKKFKTVGVTETVLKDIQAGLLVCDGVSFGRMGGFGRPGMTTPPSQPSTPFVVSFDYFRVLN
jgi:beta-glucosidase